MKKVSLLFIFCLLLVCINKAFAQPGYINIIAGDGTTGSSGDGGPATAAGIGSPRNVAVDGIGNIFILDDGNQTIRKVSPSGIISTIAGGGASLADGIPATSASLYFGRTPVIAIGRDGNVYFNDTSRIRKITLATGIISTVAGSIPSGFSGDGGPATAAMMHKISGICFDQHNNMYISDSGNIRIRKVDTAGVISTYAGTGVAGYGGDGGPAILATFTSIMGLCSDAIGNLYVADNERIRKISVLGTVSTYYYSPITLFAGNICVDNIGNLYIANINGDIEVVNPFGVNAIFTGNGPSYANGVLAADAALISSWDFEMGLCSDNFNNVYITDQAFYCYKVSATLAVAANISDSFSVYINNLCAGPEFNIFTNIYNAAYTHVTSFGDGMSSSSSILPTITGGGAIFDHIYSSPGTYTIKNTLKNGATAIDSTVYAYNYKMCNVLQATFYIDNNGNNVYDSTIDGLCNYALKIEIDSNGVIVDSISATSGFYYTAFGVPGDVYTMKIVNGPLGLLPSAPASGAINDTLGAGYIPPNKFFGLTCSSVSGNNFAVHTANRCGSHHYGGELLVDNFYCSPTGSSTLTLSISPKYNYQSAYPIPSSVSGNTLTWNFTGVSSTTAPMHISISGETPGPMYLPGDTVHSSAIIGPFIGDVDTTDNVANPVDTVKSGYDPNFIDVSPKGHALAGTRLEYTIGFENTGNDTAFNIHVLDTLSDDLDPATMEMVTASAAMNIYRYTAGGHTILKFDFPHINLLDSSHHNLCDGMLLYSIKSKSTTPDCRVISNRAGIYFDDNPVVMTNEIGVINGSCLTANINTPKANPNIDLYPNPAYDQLTIKADDGVYNNIVITNSVGATLLSKPTAPHQTLVNIQSLPAGLYYVVLKGSAGSVVRKFVKL